MEAAANGSGSQRAKIRSGTSPSSSAITELPSPALIARALSCPHPLAGPSLQQAGERLVREVKRADELADRLALHQMWKRLAEAVHRARPVGQGADGHLPKVMP